MAAQLVVRESSGLAFSDSLPALVRRIYAQRALTDAAELELTLARLIDPDALKGMPAAVELLEEALESAQRLLIVADFDADGATSCALAMTALRRL